jgi:1,4-alpha-glucan branching enzyme
MYWHMNRDSQNLVVDRGIALHKMIRLITAATAGNGYLNFMGNEFGHPEWIDFPREGNEWSYQYARRQWSLVKNQELRYHQLNDFDMEMIHMLSKAGIYSASCNHVKSDQADLVIAFERKGLLFVFNFHPVNSYTDYGLAVDAGKYKTLLCTDLPEFGGFGRFDCAMLHRTSVEHSFGYKQNLKLYLPSRTGVVLQHQNIPRVR